MNKTNNEVSDQGEKSIYEIGFHVIPVVSDEESRNYALKIRSIIEGKGGKIIAEEMPKQKNLAYEMVKMVDSKKQKFNKSFFGWIKFEIEAILVEELKKEVENIETTLRFIIVKTVKENTIFQPKLSRPKKEERVEERNEDLIAVDKVSEEEIDKSIEALI